MARSATSATRRTCGRLPDHVSFTSGSGVLLTQVDAPNGVPEPHAAVLAGLGLLMMGWLRRRQAGSGGRRASTSPATFS
jgi:hypothetical protein